MKPRQRNALIFLLLWVVFSFAVASYHPPKTLADRVLVRASRYQAWRFDPREDMRQFILILVPGLVVGGVWLWRSHRDA